MKKTKIKTLAKIVSFDIETAPTTAYIWKRWQENINIEQVLQEGYVLCAVAKFMDEEKPRTVALTDFPNVWKSNRENDKMVVKWCWDILNEADIIVAHHGKKFDIPVLNARFIAYGLTPPSPYKIVDTCEFARKKFKFPYNSLDGISRYLGIGRKIQTKFSLWSDCLAGVKSSWKKMVEYCTQDVLLLEKLYLKMLPWIENHPNLGLYNLSGNRPSCPKCGNEKITWQGFHRTTTHLYHSFKCKECGGWGRKKSSCLDKNQNIMKNCVT